MQRGYSVKIIDPTVNKLVLSDIEQTVKTERPKIIGITAMTPSIQSAVKIAKTLKPYGIPIVLGGVYMSNDHTFIERFPYFDYGVVGDGERVFYEIMQGKHPKGVIHAPRIEDLDSLPFPARHLVDITKYKRPEVNKWEPFAAGIISSRGCPFLCTFCSIPNAGKKIRFRSAKNVVDEMVQMYDSCQGTYNFNDDCFTVSKRHVLSLSQEIVDRKLKCRILGSTRTDVIDGDILKALKRMGCDNLSFGVETGSERIRNEAIGRKGNDESVIRTIKLCRKYGIVSSLFLMVGFPTETKYDIDCTIKIGDKIKADFVGIRQTIPYPGSRLFATAIKEGKIPSDMMDNWASGKSGRYFDKAWRFYIPDGFTQEEMVGFKRLTYINFYFNYKWILRTLWRWIRNPKQLIRDDFKLFKLIPQVLKLGRTKGQLS